MQINNNNYDVRTNESISIAKQLRKKNLLAIDPSTIWVWLFVYISNSWKTFSEQYKPMWKTNIEKLYDVSKKVLKTIVDYKIESVICEIPVKNYESVSRLRELIWSFKFCIWHLNQSWSNISYFDMSPSKVKKYISWNWRADKEQMKVWLWKLHTKKWSEIKPSSALQINLLWVDEIDAISIWYTALNIWPSLQRWKNN